MNWAGTLRTTIQCAARPPAEIQLVLCDSQAHTARKKDCLWRVQRDAILSVDHRVMVELRQVQQGA